MSIQNFLNVQELDRIGKNGENCDIGDTISWMQKNGQQFGIIKKKTSSGVSICLCKPRIHNFNLEFIATEEIDEICKNTVNYTRRLMIVQRLVPSPEPEPIIVVQAVAVSSK